MRRLAGLALLLCVAPASAADVAQMPAGWQFEAATGEGCPAAKLEPDKLKLTIRLVRPYEGRMLIILSDINWRLPIGKSATATMQMDDDAPVEVQGDTFLTVARFLIVDEAVAQRVTQAKVLKWRASWGRFSMEVPGIGEAYAAVPRC